MTAAQTEQIITLTKTQQYVTLKLNKTDDARVLVKADDEGIVVDFLDQNNEEVDSFAVLYAEGDEDGTFKPSFAGNADGETTVIQVMDGMALKVVAQNLTVLLGFSDEEGIRAIVTGDGGKPELMRRIVDRFDMTELGLPCDAYEYRVFTRADHERLQAFLAKTLTPDQYKELQALDINAMELTAGVPFEQLEITELVGHEAENDEDSPAP